MVVLGGGGAVSYERGTHVGEALPGLGCLVKRRSTVCLHGVEFISEEVL